MQNNTPQIPISPESRQRGHESQNPRIGNILMVIGIVVLMTIACFGIVSAMMSAFLRTRPDEAKRPRATIIAPDDAPLERTIGPHLQMNANDDLKTFRAREETELNSYGWIDRTTGVVRIPIERAMELIAQRGLPETPTNATGKSSLELIQERSQTR